ncbi:hypothetical protein TSUD_81150 [Trifolium subterraneum]|uniref:Uncharacterized protein n=1 Tax=Trifolium subterraneum TaxID=3900 RepID=A0A2Z6PB82_TRISU|nr:hypothetical protein TSUD_81150 [Trifolium subterraneum]
MPKVRTEKPLSKGSSRSYSDWDGVGRCPDPYPPVDFDLPRPRLASAEEIKELDEIKCPICMESPHNTVLLKCSSYEKGCRPYMCNTSHRHSNCLDQYCKSFDTHLTSEKLEKILLVESTASNDSKGQSGHGNPSECGNRLQPKLTCPLCRGGIYGYMVSETARSYMDSKLRSCSSETCEFQGTYRELRKHARRKHPSVRPTEVDASRRGDWERMEQERELEDVLSSIDARHGAEDSGEHTIWSGDLADLMTLLVNDMFTIEEGANWMSSLWSDPRPRMPLHDRRSETVHTVSNDTRTNQSARWRSSLPSTRQPERIHRAGSRINPSSSHDPEANSTARWRDNTLPPGMAHSEIVYNYYMEPVSPEVRTSSTRTARWRENTLPPGMAHSEIVYNYYMEPVNPEVRTSSTRMHRVSQHSRPNPSTNNSSSRRIPGRRLRWRHQ